MSSGNDNEGCHEEEIGSCLVGNLRDQTLTHELDDTSPFGRGKHVDLFWSHGDHTHYHGLGRVDENTLMR